jgi:hypothetical protein
MRKPREYKGVTYRCGFWYDHDGNCFSTAAALIVSNRDRFADADHTALMDLKVNPCEPVATLEDVVDDWWHYRYSTGKDAKVELCRRLREAFPHIDGEGA